MTRIKDLFKSRAARLLLLCLAALLLLFAVWKVFFGATGASRSELTEREARLVSLLSGMEGVKSASAMITEEEGLPVSAIVLFSGDDSILLRSRLLNVTAAALNLDKSKIQVYPARS